MNLLHSSPDVDIYVGNSLTEPLPGACDCLIVDAPYSSRCHSGHNAVDDIRAPISYGNWTPRDVRDAVRAWHPLCRGWMVSITDDDLAQHWKAAMRKVGRYVFAAIPWVARGGRVRLQGDGPSSWTCWVIVSRPRCEPYSKWGTLQGAYEFTQDRDTPLVGGKPLSLMRALVADYTRPGDLVCDPCMGAGTTLVAAKELGRRAIGIDISEEHARLAIPRLAQAVLPLTPRRPEPEQMEIDHE